MSLAAINTSVPLTVGSCDSELYTEGYLTEDAFVWAEGEPEWMPLKVVHKLFNAIVFVGVPPTSTA